ncbi:hypothetical protein GTH32_18135 [Alteromonas sp. 345S023]|uniref:Uncharacterized protein n=1 Tax=Alteromonas profundi TaxID=2696062 RepID=A0A7X5RMT9_9ALTE|nr:hypothetical protein [Alteromonas profundi]NDV93091.1 hypothetical protein [Alteromonas profundi]
MSSVHESALYNVIVAAQSLGYDLDQLMKKINVGIVGNEPNFVANTADKTKIIEAVNTAISEVKSSS